jgi:hypothetical protein
MTGSVQMKKILVVSLKGLVERVQFSSVERHSVKSKTYS